MYVLLRSKYNLNLAGDPSHLNQARIQRFKEVSQTD